MENRHTQQPLVSIIIPFFNLEDCVSYCLDSVLRQTYKNFEVICVDDGSKDGTLKMLQEYASQDSRILVYRQQNAGQAAARNKGVALASGEFVAFIDGDDYIAPNYIEAFVEGLRGSANTLAIVDFGDIAYENLSANHFCQDRTEAEWREITVSELLYRDLVSCCWGRMARKNLFERNPLNLRYYEDVEIGGGYLSSAKRIIFLDQELYFHVRRPGSTVNVRTASLLQVQDYVTALEKQVKELESLNAGKGAIAYSCAIHWSRIYKLASRAIRCAEIDSVKRRSIHEVRSRIFGILGDGNVPALSKVRLLVLSILPNLYCSSFDLFIRCKTMFCRRSVLS